MIDLEIPVGKRTRLYRFLEMLPALLTYLLIALPIILSLISPVLAAIFIIGFIIMFFVKAIGMAYRTIQGYSRLGQASKINWKQRFDDLGDPKAALDNYRRLSRREQQRLGRHLQNLQRVAESPEQYIKPTEFYHAVMVCEYKEPREVLQPTLEALFGSNFDMQRTILIIPCEERAPEANRQMAQELADYYKSQCFYSTVVLHPDGMPNEVRGKGGNITFSGYWLERFLNERHIDPENVLVTTLDADNRVHTQYLAYSAYEYIVDPERDRRAYQPIALLMNNIWDVPAPMRVLATGNSFWTIINSTRPHMLRNFSAHSQGMASLIATKFWSTRTIVEDGHQYWRSYFAFDGHYEVTPIYVPIYQDAVLAETYRKTIKAQFAQLRRWAYGASDIAYIGNLGFSKQRKVPLGSFLGHFLRLLDSHVSWATAPIIITFGAWAPLIVNSESSRSIVAHELPQVASQLQFIAMFGLFIAIFLTFKMLPPRPARYKRRRNILMLLQWLLMPVVSIVFGASAAIYSQTRLLFGKYMDVFENTVKTVKK